MGLLIGSLRASLLMTYCQVRVFGSSGLVDIPSERLYVRTIPIYGCMDRCSSYTSPKKMWFYYY